MFQAKVATKANAVSLAVCRRATSSAEPARPAAGPTQPRVRVRGHCNCHRVCCASRCWQGPQQRLLRQAARQGRRQQAQGRSEAGMRAKSSWHGPGKS